MILVAVGLLVVISGAYYYYYRKDKKDEPALKPQAGDNSVNTKQLQLQAYERLVILAERIALPNLISRVNEPSLDKRSMQLLLNQTLKQEFDYNLSQQIYVSNEAWEAVRNLKEQNLHVINQLGSILPDEMSGMEFNKKIIEFIMSQPQGSMHTLVQEALSYEARKLMA